LGIDRGFRGITYQQSIEECNLFKSDTVRIVFTDDFGYFWIFPRNPEKQEVNLGVGLLGHFECDLKQMLESFKKENGVTGRVNYVLGGPIPGGLQRPLRYKNILFVGDAGVGAFPLTGQGIYRALLSGEAAGKCIATNTVRKYPYLMNKMFIKWDVVGKNFVRMIYILRRVGPKSVECASRWFMDTHGMLKAISHG
jgi:flavin-dependent dehydrogenase